MVENQRITPCLWFDGQAEDAANFHASLLPDSRIDRLWSALTKDGGREIQCGWLKDRYGLSWQIVPQALPRLKQSGDDARKARVVEAMMRMIKLDVAQLERAHAG